MKENKEKLAGKRIGCLGWGLRATGALFALLVLLFLAAFTVEKITLAQLPEKYPPPGEMVDIGPYSLHRYCTEAHIELAAQVTDGVLIVAEGSGHFIQVEKPELVIDAIRTIVEKARRK